MRSIIITINEGEFNVHEDGKHCDGLCWGEMLDQVASLTIPKSRVGSGFPMRTNEEWVELRAKQCKGWATQDTPPPSSLDRDF